MFGSMISDHEQQEERDLQRNHNSEHNQPKVREHTRTPAQIVRKTSIRKTTDDGEQKTSREQIRTSTEQK